MKMDKFYKKTMFRGIRPSGYRSGKSYDVEIPDDGISDDHVPSIEELDAKFDEDVGFWPTQSYIDVAKYGRPASDVFLHMIRSTDISVVQADIFGIMDSVCIFITRKGVDIDFCQTLLNKMSEKEYPMWMIISWAAGLGKYGIDVINHIFPMHFWRRDNMQQADRVATAPSPCCMAAQTGQYAVEMLTFLKIKGFAWSGLKPNILELYGSPYCAALYMTCKSATPEDQLATVKLLKSFNCPLDRRVWGSGTHAYHKLPSQLTSWLCTNAQTYRSQDLELFACRFAQPKTKEFTPTRYVIRPSVQRYKGLVKNPALVVWNALDDLAFIAYGKGINACLGVKQRVRSAYIRKYHSSHVVVQIPRDAWDRCIGRASIRKRQIQSIVHHLNSSQVNASLTFY